MQKLVLLMSKPPKTQRHDDDFVDRIHSQYTVIVLVVFAVVVTMTHWIGKAITCWAPKHFTGSHIKYTNSYCWVRNTYYLPFEEYIPREEEDHLRHEILYYQWVPFILLGQAMFFYIPSVFWHGLNQKSGVDSDNILESAGSLQNTKQPDLRQKKTVFIAKQIDRFVSNRKNQNNEQSKWKNALSCLLCGCCKQGTGCYLVILYLCSKILYIANVVGQFFVLSQILGFSYHSFGTDIIDKLSNDNFDADYMWGARRAFPRVTMCDFKIRRLGNVHRYTVQCLLPINLYTEKMYAFLWFWMLLLAIVTAGSFIMWVARAIFESDRIRYVQHHLVSSKQIKVDDEADKVRCHDFVTDYLRQDGVFIMRLISHNTNRITSTDIIGECFQQWKQRRRARHKKGSLLGEEREEEGDGEDKYEEEGEEEKKEQTGEAAAV